MTFARPRASSTAVRMTRRFSSSVIVTLSPVVPHGTSTRTPPVIWYSIKSRRRGSSTAPLEVKGVTRAVAQPRSQSSFNVMVISFSHEKAHKAQNDLFVLFCSDDFLNHFREFKYACSAGDPMGCEQGATREALARTCCMRQQNL